MTKAETLLAAVKAAIANGCDRKSISVSHWAETYRVTQKQIRDTWAAQLTNVPPNTDNPVEGK